MNRQWVLCLDQTDEQIELALHLVMLFKLRKHDSIIFLGKDMGLVRHVAALEPSMFRSNSPIFLPVTIPVVTSSCQRRGFGFNRFHGKQCI